MVHDSALNPLVFLLLAFVIVTKYNYVTITKLGGIMETPKKPGRPAKLGAAMTDRQRASAYRMRRYEAASMAHENLHDATTAVLLAGLARQLKATSDPDHADIARSIAGKIIKQLCDRHEIVLT